MATILGLITQPEALAAYLTEIELPNQTAILAFLAQASAGLSSYKNLLQKIQEANGNISGSLDAAFHDCLWQWFEQKLVVVEDYYATGNQVIEIIGNATPPGFYNKIMGIQNIKGTGLDFVYRWQAWETCYKACQQLQSSNAAESNQGLRALASFQEYGLLTEETMRTTLAKIIDSAMAQNEFYQAELSIIKANFENALSHLNNQNDAKTSGNSWLAFINNSLEAFLDAGDAVKRRKIANQIYKDLVSERISHQRAALELQKLNKRQKGGWLDIGSGK